MILDMKENERLPRKGRIQCLSKFHLTTEGMQMKVINQISLPMFTLIYSLAFSFDLNLLKIKIKKGGQTERFQPFIHNLFFSKIKMGQKCHSR